MVSEKEWELPMEERFLKEDVLRAEIDWHIDYENYSKIVFYGPWSLQIKAEGFPCCGQVFGFIFNFFLCKKQSKIQKVKYVKFIKMLHLFMVKNITHWYNTCDLCVLSKWVIYSVWNITR